MTAMFLNSIGLAALGLLGSGASNSVLSRLGLIDDDERGRGRNNARWTRARYRRGARQIQPLEVNIKDDN